MFVRDHRCVENALWEKSGQGVRGSREISLSLVQKKEHCQPLPFSGEPPRQDGMCQILLGERRGGEREGQGG